MRIDKNSKNSIKNIRIEGSQGLGVRFQGSGLILLQECGSAKKAVTHHHAPLKASAEATLNASLAEVDL